MFGSGYNSNASGLRIMRGMPRISRRQLAAFAAAGSAVTQKLPAANKPLPLRPELDPVAYTLDRYRQAPMRLTFRAQTRSEAVAWQRKLRAKLRELLGSFPAQASPLTAEVFETREFESYRRERILFATRPGVLVSAYLLTPKGAAGKLPVMICHPGHGRGADDLVGIDEKGQDRFDKAGYQHDFAIQAVERGYAAVAIEPMAFGCRRDAITAKKGAGASACQPAAGAALLLGETMIGWRVHDIVRTIDWIGTRQELDSRRIGLMGISGGGTVTLFSAALDTRIRAAWVSGYLNTFRDSIVSLSHCIDNYVPGILNWAEMYDVAGLVAPRALFAESGQRDTIFPVEAFRESFGKVGKVYSLLGAEHRIDSEIFPEGHVFWGNKGWDFVKNNL
jgi:dienelactone hydrolase